VEPSGGGELLIPFAREICREIDTEHKLIRVWLPAGFLAGVS
jgi:ribosomal 30S subunit maturation factor RimM